jgi:hypothetical protein
MVTGLVKHSSLSLGMTRTSKVRWFMVRMRCLSVYLSICLSVCLSVCLSICRSVGLSYLFGMSVIQERRKCFRKNMSGTMEVLQFKRTRVCTPTVVPKNTYVGLPDPLPRAREDEKQREPFMSSTCDTSCLSLLSPELLTMKLSLLVVGELDLSPLCRKLNESPG